MQLARELEELGIDFKCYEIPGQAKHQLREPRDVILLKRYNDNHTNLFQRLGCPELGSIYIFNPSIADEFLGQYLADKVTEPWRACLETNEPISGAQILEKLRG